MRDEERGEKVEIQKRRKRLREREKEQKPNMDEVKLL